MKYMKTKTPGRDLRGGVCSELEASPLTLISTGDGVEPDGGSAHTFVSLAILAPTFEQRAPQSLSSELHNPIGLFRLLFRSTHCQHVLFIAAFNARHLFKAIENTQM